MFACCCIFHCVSNIFLFILLFIFVYFEIKKSIKSDIDKDGIISNKKGVSFKTSMNFNHNWGLGSSSTLIHNLSKWADVEPFSVYWKVTSGSGYDLASCKYDKPIIYQLINLN